MAKVYLFRNPKTGEITEHSSSALRSDPVSNILLEFIGEKNIEEKKEVDEKKHEPEVTPKGRKRK